MLKISPYLVLISHPNPIHLISSSLFIYFFLFLYTIFSLSLQGWKLEATRASLCLAKHTKVIEREREWNTNIKNEKTKKEKKRKEGKDT